MFAACQKANRSGAPDAFRRPRCVMELGKVARYFTSGALQEIESFFKRSHKFIVALTVQEILDEQIAKKLV
jgi:hypothetical protein